MLRRRTKVAIWIVIVAILLLGMRQVLANPQHSDTNPNKPVVISEFMASNGGGLADEDGDYLDWIELHNRGRMPVDLDGWSLTDDPTQPDKWVFPSYTLHAGERIIVFASGKDRREVAPEAGAMYFHTSFRLDADGGFLALYSPTTRRYLDATEYEYPVQELGVSYGVLPGQAIQPDNMRYFDIPTPGAANDTASAWVGRLEPVVVSQPHGIYTDTVRVELSHPNHAASIYYTTNGSVPTMESSIAYTEPLQISSTTPLRAAAFISDTHSSPVTTRTYIFVDDVLAQTAAPVGFPAEWGTHLVDIGGYEEGSPVEADYAMDPVIVAEAGDAVMQDALLTLPTLSLVMDMDDFETLYANPRERGEEWEKPVSVELLPSNDDRAGFQADAGVRIQGGAGRWEFMPKHSFRLFFKQQFGAPKLEYKFFDDSPLQAFDTLVLRGGVDRSFAGHPSTPELPVDHRQATYLRDEWLRQSQITLSHVGSHGDFVQLYINGLYWGIYNVIERPDASFAAAYLGDDKDDWFSANHGGAVSGLPDRFNVMLDLATQGGLDDPDKYATMLEFVDPVQFSDYMIVNWYAGNYDWPANNWYVDVAYPAGRNLFFVWDAEGTWEHGAEILLGPDHVDGAPYPNVAKLVFEALMENANFRLVFADRLYQHVSAGGALSDEASMQRWSKLADAVEPAIVAESARWGDVRYDDPITVDDWRRASDNVLAQMAGNGLKLLRLARDAGYYPAVDPPLFEQSDVEDDSQSTLAMSQTEHDVDKAAIYYTLDGTDPRDPVSGEPTGEHYSAPIRITAPATVKARTLVEGEWSALNQHEYELPGQASNVRITEIMYHPSEDPDAEFLELTNVGELDADLGGAYLEGVEYRFPKNTSLAAGESIVLIRDFKRFRRRYPDAEVFGIYEGALSNRGERILLRARDGAEIDSVRYDDENGWPLSADGAGDSLVLHMLNADSSSPTSWRASLEQNGTPGVWSVGQ